MKLQKTILKTITTSVLCTSLFLMQSCGSEDTPALEKDTEKPKVTLSNITVLDIDADGVENDISGTITVTDNEKVVEKTVKVGTIPGAISGTTFTITGLPVGVLTVSASAEDAAGNIGSATENVTIAMPNTAPEIRSLVIATVDKYTKAGDEVGTLDVVDAEGDTLTYTFVDGGDLFELDANNKIIAKVDFGRQEEDQVLKVTIKVSDGDLFDQESIDVNSIGTGPEVVNLPDVTYKRNLWNENTGQNELADTDTTEDLSYTGDQTGHPVRIITNGQEKVLIGVNTDGTPKYELYTAELKKLEAASVGDASINDMINTLAAGSYKIGEFTKINDNGIIKLKNKHGVIIDKDVLGQAYMNMVETFGVNDESIDSSPKNASGVGGYTQKNLQIVRVAMTNFFKGLHSVTADLTVAEQEALIKKLGVEAFGQARGMTADERLAVMSVLSTQGWIDNNW